MKNREKLSFRMRLLLVASLARVVITNILEYLFYK